MSKETQQNTLVYALSSKKEEDKRQDLLSIPNQHTRFLYNALSNSEQLDLFMTRARAIEKGKAEYSIDEKRNAILRTTDTLELSLAMPKKERRPVKNIALYVLHKLGETHVEKDLFNDISISFPLTDLVEIGMYKDERTARKGYNRALEEITSIKLRAISRDASTEERSKDISVMFIKGGIHRGTCYMFLNKYIDWDKFALSSYALLPRYYFSLPAKAQDLFYNIFSIARQHTRGQQGDYIEFNIGFRNIQNMLALKPEETTKNPQRDIINPILDAIEKCQKELDIDKVILEPKYNRAGNIRTFLDGYLKVTMRGLYAEKILEIAHNREKYLRENTSKKQLKAR